MAVMTDVLVPGRARQLRLVTPSVTERAGSTGAGPYGSCRRPSLRCTQARVAVLNRLPGRWGHHAAWQPARP
ncbi:hypothetical protein QFZ22_002748 [Streptomyces canus]|uniref:Uncharacterized protein n=1 Tax=Streptomyces canus TaxID=58343 RepID=A0AAW8FAC3_9ACTN|nr:hypothetical protein [Streptomyces canus]MDQ0906763.1 hypothetical protein [Streptomyces canus]